MSLGNRRVAARMAAWKAAFDRGEIRLPKVGLRLGPDERAAVSFAWVRVSTEHVDTPFADWRPRPGARDLHLPFRNDGRLVATDQRLCLVRRARQGVWEVHRSWVWADVFAVDLVPNLRGVSIRADMDDPQIEVVAHVFHTFLVRPSPVALAAGWLKVEGAFWASLGRLDEWFARLPKRLAPSG